MRTEHKDILNQYTQMKIDAKMLEDKMKELNPQVLEIMKENEAEEIELDSGKLTMGSRRTWKYSANVKAKEEELKEAKKNEEQLGLADYTENHYVIFKGFKEEVE